MHELRSEAQSVGKAGIKGCEFELFVEESDDQYVKKESCPDDESGTWDGEERGLILEESDHIERGVFEGTIKNTSGIQINMVSSFSNQDKPDCKEGRKDNPHRRAAFDFTKAGYPLSEKCSENSGNRRAEEHPDISA